ncbi:MAG: hypothetical protein KF801_01660 [Cryobacterium sp.]|nr:hypothetical protein [Cryobacterium sp.]
MGVRVSSMGGGAEDIRRTRAQWHPLDAIALDEMWDDAKHWLLLAARE